MDCSFATLYVTASDWDAIGGMTKWLVQEIFYKKCMPVLLRINSNIMSNCMSMRMSVDVLVIYSMFACSGVALKHSDSGDFSRDGLPVQDLFFRTRLTLNVRARAHA